MGNVTAFYPARGQGNWSAANSGVYTDGRLFREEQDKVFGRCWLVACHESEISNAYDYRTFLHPAGPWLFVIRGMDRKVRSFYNLCPLHGTSLLPGPSGNARRMACGGLLEPGNRHCADIARVLRSGDTARRAEEVVPQEVRTSIGYGGFVWLNLDSDCVPLKEYVGDAMSIVEPYLNRPLQVFMHERRTVNMNYKLWRQTKGEFYLGHLYHSDRLRRMFQPAYCNLHYTDYLNGHASVGSTQAEHLVPGLKEMFWPGLAPAAWILVDLFPCVTYSLRSSLLRVETVIPIKVDQTMVEVRALALKSDTAAQRTKRLLHHDGVWGDFGPNGRRNWRELASRGFSSDASRSTRDHFEERDSLMEPQGLRHFHTEWDRRMGRSVSDPYRPSETAALYASSRN